MRIEELRSNLEKRALRSGLKFTLNPPAGEDALERASHVLGAALPSQVLMFYRAHNGMRVEQPSMSVLPIEELRAGPGGLVHFVTVGDAHRLGFNVGARNAAGQWDIVSMDTGTLITLTMASFWSNKVFAWLDKRRPIWAS